MAPAADPADERMLARAHERFAGDRRKRRRRAARGSLPNLLVIGGLKCGTTSLHHYLGLHPDAGMSRPKELNFFCEGLNWDLGPDWYASHFDSADGVRGETSPHYAHRARFDGVPERIAATLGETVRLIYMVRDPVERLLSHYLHNVGGGYESRPLVEAIAGDGSSYVTRGLYAWQLEPYLAAFGDERIAIIAQEELDGEREATMKRVFEFAGIDPGFVSEEFDRRWETGSAKGGGGFRVLDRAVRLPGLRSIDRNFDRLPESLRWRAERIVHDPDSGPGDKPELDGTERERLNGLFKPDITELERLAGRNFGWLS